MTWGRGSKSVEFSVTYLIDGPEADIGLSYLNNQVNKQKEACKAPFCTFKQLVVGGGGLNLTSLRGQNLLQLGRLLNELGFLVQPSPQAIRILYFTAYI